MPDADVDSTVKALAGAAFGAAGQRCMAISAAVFVGGFTDKWREPLLEAARGLKLNAGWEKDADVGPMISPEVRVPRWRGREGIGREGGAFGSTGP